MAAIRKEFQDAHLSLKQKQYFWASRMKIGREGEGHTATVMRLASFPMVAPAIYHKYHAFCRVTSPGFPQGMNASNGNVATAATPINHDGVDQFARDIMENTSYGAPILNCMCGVAIEPADEGMCLPCWMYFTVFAKSLSIHQECAEHLNALLKIQTAEITAANSLSKEKGENPFDHLALPVVSPTMKDPIDLFTQQKISSQPTASSQEANVSQQTVSSMGDNSPTAIDLRSPSMASASIGSIGSKPMTTPQRTHNPIMSEEDPVQSPAKSKSGKVLKRCKTCKRQFPVNLKKNDGINCTWCINKYMKTAAPGDANEIKLKSSTTSVVKKKQNTVTAKADEIPTATLAAKDNTQQPLPPRFVTPASPELFVGTLPTYVTTPYPPMTIDTSVSGLANEGTIDPRLLTLNTPVSPHYSNGSFYAPFGSLSGSSMLEAPFTTPTKKRKSEGAADLYGSTKRLKL